LGARWIEATYLPTPKNGVCLSFWVERSGFERLADGSSFRRTVDRPFPTPEGIELVLAAKPKL